MGNFRLQTDGHSGWWSVGKLQVSAEVKVVVGSVDVMGSRIEAISYFHILMCVQCTRWATFLCEALSVPDGNQYVVHRSPHK